MTNNQINYQKNILTEMQINESIRHNKASEAIGWGNLSELHRHSVVSEGISQGNLDELFRHNQKAEYYQILGINENIRHNKENERISWGNLNELTHHNTVYDEETIRYNKNRNATDYINAISSLFGNVGKFVGSFTSK